MPDTMRHICHPTCQEAEKGGFPGVCGHLVQHSSRPTCLKKAKQNTFFPSNQHSQVVLNFLHHSHCIMPICTPLIMVEWCFPLVDNLSLILKFFLIFSVWLPLTFYVPSQKWVLLFIVYLHYLTIHYLVWLQNMVTKFFSYYSKNIWHEFPSKHSLSVESVLEVLFSCLCLSVIAVSVSWILPFMVLSALEKSQQSHDTRAYE